MRTDGEKPGERLLKQERMVGEPSAPKFEVSNQNESLGRSGQTFIALALVATLSPDPGHSCLVLTGIPRLFPFPLLNY